MELPITMEHVKEIIGGLYLENWALARQHDSDQQAIAALKTAQQAAPPTSEDAPAQDS